MSQFRKYLFASVAVTAVALATPAVAGDVVGTVVDDSNTVALQSASVRIVELNREATTDRTGRFVFADVPAGTYTVQVSYVGAETKSLSVVVPASGRVNADFSIGDSSGQILVIGQSANQASALSRKRSSDVVSDVLTRDAVGQFPDQNVAESLRRLPGINVLNDQGEGRFVSVRGLDPELNATSLNGVRVPAPESDVRSVALDVISSGLIEAIEVKKSLTPDMDGDTIGASIEISTTNAFARRKDLLTATVEGSYNDYSSEITPKGSVDFATRLGEDVGVSGGVSYYQRKFESDNIEADGWGEDDGLIFPEEVNYRDYDVERERISANLNFDFRVGDSTMLYARGVYSQFSDQEFRRETSFKLEDAGNRTGSGSAVTFADTDPSDPTNEDHAIEIQRSIKDRYESQRIRTVVLGGETETGGWTAKYSGSWARSTERENGSVDPANFVQAFGPDQDLQGLNMTFDFADPRKPLYSVGGTPAAVTAFSNPAAYALEDITLTALSDSVDEEFAARFDLGREFAMSNGTFSVQAGVKSRWRDKSYNLEAEYWENGDLSLADVLGDQTYRLADISPVPNYLGAREIFFDNRADFELNEVDTLFDSAVEDYSVSEDVLAGYLLGRWDSATLRVIGGVRLERTSNTITGNNVLLVEEGGTVPGTTTPVDEDTVVVTPVNVQRDYEHWLPSLNVRWEASDNLVARLAGYRSLVRPKLSALAPRFVVEQNDADEREGSFGNPDLLPYEAWNFDASVEYYLSSNGALSAAVFYKDVKNFVAEIELEGPDTYRGIAFDEATTFINGDSGKIFGVEVGYSQAFRMLPAPLDGLILQANYTYTDATGTVPNDGDPTDLRDITLPASSKHTFNVGLGYDKGPFDIRLSGTYRDSYLDELGAVAEEDRYVDDHFQLDLSAKYQVNRNLQVFYEWVNINNAKYFAFNNFAGQRNLLQFEQYNWTMKGGLKVTF